jgi:integrase
VDGDLVAAIARARQIDERLTHFKASGLGTRKTGHRALVEQYQIDLRHRADAGEIDPRTVDRYASALTHYLAFAEQPAIERQFPHAGGVNREFALAFRTHLNTVLILPNGHPHSQPQPMQSQEYVVDVVRGMYQWAADAERGHLLPEGFRNPFTRRGGHKRAAASISLANPDITVDMAADFLGACDAYQLRLFSPLVIYGLRAAEPCLLFYEHLRDGWLDVPCLPELAYYTKGRREKRLPIIAGMDALLRPAAETRTSGLLYLRRGTVVDSGTVPLIGGPLKMLVAEFQRRCAAAKIRTAAERQRVRDELLREAGGITYDHIVGEFSKIVRELGWPPSATIKDFRHLFATGLENAGIPEHYRKFLMGQSPGRAAIVTYTHLNEIHQRFDEAVQRQFQPLVDALRRRTAELAQ